LISKKSIIIPRILYKVKKVYDIMVVGQSAGNFGVHQRILRDYTPSHDLSEMKNKWMI